MSHFTSIKTKMVEKVYLVKALEDLGYPYEDGGQAGSSVQGWQGRTTKAELKVKVKNSNYEIGFVKSPTGYELVADWSELRQVNRTSFVEQLSQRYAYQATKAKLEEQGFTLVNEEKEADGRIHLLVRRMA